MATQINILPSIVIDRIVLESGGSGYNKKLKDNPHINEETEYAITRSGGKSIKTALGNSRPKAAIDNVFSTNGNTKVTVTVIAKDTLEGKNDLPLWIDNDYIKKFLVINIVAVKDKNALDNLLSKHIEKIIRGKPFDDLEQNKVRHFKIGLNEVNVESRASSLNTGPQRRAVGSSYTSYDKATRKNVYNVPYSITFEIPEPQSNLMLVAFVSIDLNNSGENNPLVDEFGINPTNFDVIYSSPLVERVLTSAGIAGTTDYFVTPDGMPWTGPIHHHSPADSDETGKYMTGHQMSGRSVDLSRKRVQNYKISDFRRIERLTTSRNLDFTSTENLVSQLNNRLRMASERPLYVGKNISYMSELYMTPSTPAKHPNSDTNDMINNMFFILDWRKLVKEHSLFPSLLDYPQKDADNDRIEEILNFSEILSFQLYREKVVNKDESSFGTFTDVDEDIVPELIVSTSDNSSSRALVSKIQTKIISYGVDGAANGGEETHSEIKVGSVREIAGAKLLAGNGHGMRLFTITDGSAKYLTAGKYQYTLKLRIKNGTNQYLQNKIAEIRKSLRDLKRYESRASKGANNKGTGSWNNIYKRFTKQFINSEKSNVSAWADPIKQYLECAQLVYQNSGNFYSVAGIQKNFKNMCAPQTGSPKGISIVINLIEDFITRMTKALGSNSSLNKDGLGFIASRPENKPSAGRRVFDYEYTFNDILDIGFLTTHTGYEYIGSSINGLANMGNAWTSSPGIKQINRSQYQARLTLEIKKYILSNVVDNNSQDAMTFTVAHIDPISAANTKTFSDFIDVYESVSKYLTPSGIKFTAAIADVLEGEYLTGINSDTFNIKESEAKKIARTSLLSLIEHAVAGSYSVKFKNNYTWDKKAAGGIEKHTVAGFGSSATTSAANSYLSVLEKYNCHIVSSDANEYNNYSIATKPNREENMGIPIADGTFITDEEGNEILNPALAGTDSGNAAVDTRMANRLSSAGLKYSSTPNQTFYLPTSHNIVRGNVFSKHLDAKEDYDLGSEQGRVRTILSNKGRRYVNNLPLPLLTMLFEQSPSSKAGSALKRGTTGIAGHTDPYIWMLYKNIVSVEVLVAFEGDQKYVTIAGEEKRKMTTKHVAASIWSPLTQKIMNSLLAVGAQQAVCRLKRYYNEDFNVRESILTTEIPIMNQYFIINLAEVSATVETIPAIETAGGGTGGGYGG
jgi:hypothetical protein